ncbi:hypothetical protein HDU83_005081 [Entophlyctis luteolus]|nr:hypothetical protein HDU83_005081 [Entophlyctis luteolus]
MSSPPPYSSSLLPIVFESKDGQRHSTEFDLAWLCERAIDQFDGEPQSKRTHQTLSPSVAAKKSLPTNLWAASEFANLRSSAGDFDYNLLMESGQSNSEDTLFALLMQLQSHGLAFIKNVPTNEVDSQHFLPQLEIIIKRLGCHIRETFYGRTWDVKSVKDAKNIAYTSLDLGLHMDLILKNSVTGGESIFLDSYKAARILKQEYPHYYKTLTEIPVTFHYDNDSHLMKQHRFTISESDINSDAPDNLRVFYSPPFQGPFEHVRSAEDMEAVVMALRAFEDVMRRPEMLYETRSLFKVLFLLPNTKNQNPDWSLEQPSFFATFAFCMDGASMTRALGKGILKGHTWIMM